jgi:hypothetical protein
MGIILQDLKYGLIIQRNYGLTYIIFSSRGLGSSTSRAADVRFAAASVGRTNATSSWDRRVLVSSTGPGGPRQLVFAALGRHSSLSRL